jgi:hypothetical protein
MSFIPEGTILIIITLKHIMVNLSYRKPVNNISLSTKDSFIFSIYWIETYTMYFESVYKGQLLIEGTFLYLIFGV